MDANSRSESPLRAFLPLVWRLALVGGVLAAELMLRASVGGGLPGGDFGFPLQRYVYSVLVTWVAALVILSLIGNPVAARRASDLLAGKRPQLGWLLVHLLLIAPVVWPPLITGLVQAGLPLFAGRLLDHALAITVAFALVFSVLGRSALRELLQGSRRLALFCLLIALVAVLTTFGMQRLWSYSADVTFAIVRVLLHPFYPDLLTDAAQRVLHTRTIEIRVDETCSGLEGIGLMLTFCAGWIWYQRREFRFPAVLTLIPAALLTVFLLNSVRIAALFAIAEGGHPDIALAGFHSQAGWLLFNATALVVAVVSRRIHWLRRADANPARPLQQERDGDDRIAAFLLPLLAVLAMGMLTRAMSSGFDALYWLRLPAALCILYLYRRDYRDLDWRFGWHGIAGGVVVFLLWLLAAHWLSAKSDMPAALAQMQPLSRAAWIAARAAIAALIVPVVEELAFRGFLMRRLASAHFTAVRLADVRIFALLGSSVLFGLSHGSFWLPGIMAGLVFGAVARRTNRFGEAVAAHAVANALLAATVLAFGQWELW